MVMVSKEKIWVCVEPEEKKKIKFKAVLLHIAEVNCSSSNIHQRLQRASL